MAGRVTNYNDNDTYKDAIEGINQMMQNVDLNNPARNVINPEITTNELLKLQAETQAHTMNEILEFMRTMITLTPDKPDELQLLAETAGEKVSVMQQQNHLEKLAKKNYLITRMIQQRYAQKDAKAT